MPYNAKLKELIRRVEATRPERVEQVRRGESFPMFPEKEADEVLHQYHPDYKKGTKRPLEVGPNKGDVVPNEVADLLEARSRIDPDAFDLDSNVEETDVLVIGGGGAGGAAALTANEGGVRVTVCTKLRLGDANTMMAEGGIQAADRAEDSPAIHYLDAMGGGHFTNVPELVKTLVMDAPATIQWLEKLGLMFDKDSQGNMEQLHGGGTSRKRMHSAGDMTGAEIMRTLRDEIRNRPEIRVIEFAPAVELLLDTRGRCVGAILFNMETENYHTVLAKATVLTTGGFGRLHIQGFPTTNHYGATADGLVIAYRAGASLCFMDASQFHPTGVVYPEQNVGLLITEKFRGAGAQLINIHGEQFCYPLEPRDIESSAVIRECTDRKNGIETPTGRVGVWLDSPMIEILEGEGAVAEKFPAKHRQFMRHEIDIGKEPMLVYPTLHYQNGGIKITPDTETEIPLLFAAGEVSGGIHGRNRLMGNSLLDVTVFGRRAGNAALEAVSKAKPGKPGLNHVKAFHEALNKEGLRTDGNVSPMVLPDYAGKIG